VREACKKGKNDDETLLKSLNAREGKLEATRRAPPETRWIGRASKNGKPYGPVNVSRKTMGRSSGELSRPPPKKGELFYYYKYPTVQGCREPDSSIGGSLRSVKRVTDGVLIRRVQLSVPVEKGCLRGKKPSLNFYVTPNQDQR